MRSRVRMSALRPFNGRLMTGRAVSRIMAKFSAAAITWSWYGVACSAETRRLAPSAPNHAPRLLPTPIIGNRRLPCASV